MTDNEQVAANQLSALIFGQLMESERFRTFFELNFEVRKVVDDEAKTIDYVVIERPPEVVAQDMMRMTQEEEENAPKIQVVPAEALKRGPKRKSKR